MKLKLLKALYLFVIKTRLYFAWSAIYRFFAHRKYKNVEVAKELKPKEVLNALSLLKWSKDGPTQLWDAVGAPEYVQHNINEATLGKPTARTGLDCDEFSIWAAHAIEMKYMPVMLNVAYIKKNGKIGGHNMALCSDHSHGFFHISNWGLFGTYDRLDLVIKDILWKQNAELIGWFVASKDLKLRMTFTDINKANLYSHRF